MNSNNKKTADFETVSFDSQYNRSIEQPNPDQWLLDHFAGLAMNGFISKYGNEGAYPVLSEMSYQVAKAMLKARKEVGV